MHRRVHHLKRKEFPIGELRFLHNALPQKMINLSTQGLTHDHPVEFGNSGLMRDTLDGNIVHLKGFVIYGKAEINNSHTPINMRRDE